MTKVRILIPGVVVLVLAAVALFLHPGTDSPAAVAGAGTPTATVPVHTVQLSKVDADSDAPLAGWELIAYRGPDCQDHPVNDIFTQTQPVQMQLQAGMYSFLETMQAGWVNVTPLCQPVDLTSGDGELVFENRQQGTPTSGSPTPVGTPTATPATHTVTLSKKDADSGELLAGWELIAYRGPDCQGHPINDIFTATTPVTMDLAAGVYSFLETLRPGWVNVTPTCQAVDLTAGDGELVFRNRLLSPLGDTDCDGMVTSVDAALVLQLDARLIDAVSCPFQADANHDGLWNSIDALLILQDVAGLIDLGS